MCSEGAGSGSGSDSGGSGATSDPPSMLALVDALARRSLSAVGPVTDFETLTSGANKGTWSFAAPLAEGTRKFVLQRQAPSGAIDPDAGADDWVPHLSGTEEFRVMQAAEAADVPVPHVQHILLPDDGLGEGAVTRLVEGETLAARILREDRFAATRGQMAAQCGRILADIHRVPTDDLLFLRRFDAEAMLSLFRRTLDSIDYPVPVLELALRWARERQPTHTLRTLVHGDFRSGNFIVSPEGIRAVLDWEIAHVGQPMEDLGYLCMRTWRFGGPKAVGGFGSRDDLYAAYEKSGGRIDRDEAHFWEVVGSMRWAFGCLRRAFSFRHQSDRKLEFAAVGRRLEEPLYDILDTIEGRDI